MQGDGQVPLLGAGLVAGAADCLVQRRRLVSWALEGAWEFARRNGGDSDCSTDRISKAGLYLWC